MKNYIISSCKKRKKYARKKSARLYMYGWKLVTCDRWNHEWFFVVALDFLNFLHFAWITSAKLLKFPLKVGCWWCKSDSFCLIIHAKPLEQSNTIRGINSRWKAGYCHEAGTEKIWSRKTWVWVSALFLLSWVTLDKINFPVKTEGPCLPGAFLQGHCETM